MRDEHPMICSPAMFELLAPDAPVVPVKVELLYSIRDPYAVRASFRTGHDSAVDWVFARDLLANGMLRPAGTGDVRIRPAHDPGRTELELTSPSGHAVFTTCTATLAEFLKRTFDAVPPGAEYSWLDLDSALCALLDNDRARD